MKKKNILRSAVSCILLVLLFILAFFLQSLIIPSIGLQIPVYLLLPLTVSVAMFEKDFAGMFFGILAGVLFDITSAAPDGIYALFFAAAGFTVGLLASRYFRNTAFVAFLMTLAGDLLLCTLSFFANSMTEMHGSLWIILRGFYIPAFIITAVTLPPVYYITAAIEKIKK